MYFKYKKYLLWRIPPLGEPLHIQYYTNELLCINMKAAFNEAADAAKLKYFICKTVLSMFVHEILSFKAGCYVQYSSHTLNVEKK